MQILKTGALYFALVFGAGFVLGPKVINSGTNTGICQEEPYTLLGDRMVGAGPPVQSLRG